jgi:arginyl-tRNA synthetase
MSDAGELIARTEIAGPGFINFFLHPAAWPPVVRQVLILDQQYGASDMGRGKRVQVEFVSANPTGPLHVGHGRGAAVGDSVARVLSFCGFDVQREYYINDSGRQIATLGRSVYLRCQELLGRVVDFPQDCYQGDYISDLAREMMDSDGPDIGP